MFWDSTQTPQAPIEKGMGMTINDQQSYIQLEQKYSLAQKEIEKLQNEVKRLEKQVEVLSVRSSSSSSGTGGGDDTTILSSSASSSLTSCSTKEFPDLNAYDDETVEMINGAARKRSVLSRIISDLEQGNEPPPSFGKGGHRFELKKGMLYYGDKLCIGKDSRLHKKLLQMHHDRDGHGDLEATIRKLKHYYYWPGSRSFAQNYIEHCDACKSRNDEVSGNCNGNGDDNDTN